VSTRKGALAGLRVIEFGGFAAGPGIGKHLRNYGADVIRVESSMRLDGFRFSYPPFMDNIPGPERAGIFNFYNDGKRSITLNLKHPRGQELARTLVATADVVIENFTPGTMTRLGLDYSVLKQDNPELILLSTCNQGQFGPHAHHRGFGSHLTSLSGFTHVLGVPDGPPELLYGPYIDYIAVGFGTAAVLAALYRRRRTGTGCEIDLSQYEAGLQFMTPALLDFVVNGRVAKRNGNRHPHAAPHGVFACRADEREEWVALSVMDDAEWQRFVCALDSPGWAIDRRFETVAGRKANEDALEAHLAAWTAGVPRDDIVRRLRANDLRVYPVNSMADLFEDPQLAARGFWRTVEHPVMGPLRVEAPPALLRATPPEQTRPAPLMGEHTAEVLTEILGLSPEQIDGLYADGALD
jgi:crotonobetainyl-CoA:carnitine CoA-transferase CaiB-like acyl-CoA transferase